MTDRAALGERTSTDAFAPDPFEPPERPFERHQSLRPPNWIGRGFRWNS